MPIDVYGVILIGIEQNCKHELPRHNGGQHVRIRFVAAGHVCEHFYMASVVGLRALVKICWSLVVIGCPT